MPERPYTNSDTPPEQISQNGPGSLRGASPSSSDCASGDISSKPLWNGWGNGVSNARFQSAKEAGLSADQVPNLKLKWAFGFPGAEEVYGQPTVAGGRVFLGVDTGAVYSIDAESGCVFWSYQADAGVRTAISIGPVKGKGPAKYGVYFGALFPRYEF